jgi:prevent-host-death family protein
VKPAGLSAGLLSGRGGQHFFQKAQEVFILKTVGAYEAKTHLLRLLDRVRKGECIVITRHGTAIAVLRPLENAEKGDPAEVIAEILKFREQHTLDGLTVRELIEEGRR